MKQTRHAWLIPTTLALAVLAACGGGSTASTAAAGTTTTAGTSSSAGTAAGATSSGTITAFGSVFVNGHEYRTASAKIIDDDTGTTPTDALEVGQVVDVQAASDSTATAPTAATLHVHPLVRGVVDAIDSTTGTLTVMGQTVQITSSTTFSDHRACISASTSACTAVSSSSGLSATSGSGSSAVAGSYVTVEGYLYDSGSGNANVVATLVAVRDTPTSAKGPAYKVEGVATVDSSGAVTVGGLSLDLGSATCTNASGKVACASAFTTGEVVSAWATAAPTLPATTLSATHARLSGKLPVETTGASVELEGRVSSVGTTSFVVRGVTVDATALPSGTALPAVGDVVRVEATVAAGGQSVTASSLTVLHAAASKRFDLEGDETAVSAGSTSGTWVLTVLGQSIAVNADTRLADRSSKTWDRVDPAADPFNATTFETYLAASTSKHVVVTAQTDSSGALTARAVTLVPASTVTGVAGPVDTSPAPTSGSTVTFAVHGVAVTAPASAVVTLGGHGHGSNSSTAGTTASVSAGDQVVALGTAGTDGGITVASGTSMTNGVLDLGAASATPDDGDPRGL